MAFVDVINNYADGTTGTLSTTDGGSVGYTITGNAPTDSRAPANNNAAKINANGTDTKTVTFDDPVNGMTVQVGRSNTGEVYFIEIDGVTVDLNTLIASGEVIFTTSSPGTHQITASGGIEGTNSSGANNDLAFLHFNTAVTSVGFFGTGGNSGNFDLFEVGVDSVDFRVVCYAAGTLIQTPTGAERVEDLQAGAQVLTLDAGAQPVLWQRTRRVSAAALAADPKLWPVRIRAHALGPGYPNRTLMVSRQHRMLVSSRIAQRLLGRTEFLVPAIHLVGFPGITLHDPGTELDYVHFLVSGHHLVLANGAPSETLLPGPEALRAIGQSQQDMLATLLCSDGVAATIRPVPPRKDSRKVLERHLRHARPLLEAYQPCPEPVALS
ncbi:MAG: Hint domain-containing protein [Pseudomonadota bacterium]